jgi:biotin carboxyl carrier protein
MSGIFYRAPSPSSPPYVREGDTVKEGQVICVLEAMKVFNEIKAEFNCVIEKVLQENGKPVEPNGDLFQVRR